MSMNMSINTMPSINDDTIVIEYEEEFKIRSQGSLDFSDIDLDLDLDFSVVSSSINFASTTLDHNPMEDNYYFHSKFATIHWTYEVRLNQTRAFLVLILVHGFIPMGNWLGQQTFSILISIGKMIGVYALCFLSAVPKIMDAVNPTEGYPNYDAEVMSSTGNENKTDPKIRIEEPFYSMEHTSSFGWKYAKKLFFSRRAVRLFIYVGFWLYLMDTIEQIFSSYGTNSDVRAKGNILEKTSPGLSNSNYTCEHNLTMIIDENIKETKEMETFRTNIYQVEEYHSPLSIDDIMLKTFETVVENTSRETYLFDNHGDIEESKSPLNINGMAFEPLLNEISNSSIETYISKSFADIEESEGFLVVDDMTCEINIKDILSPPKNLEEPKEIEFKEENDMKVDERMQRTNISPVTEEVINTNDEPLPAKHFPLDKTICNEDIREKEIYVPLGSSFMLRILLLENQCPSIPQDQQPLRKSDEIEVTSVIISKDDGDLITKMKQINFFELLTFIMQRKQRKIIEVYYEMFQSAM